MSNSVDPDVTAHMSRLIWIYAVCKKLLLSSVAVKELIQVQINLCPSIRTLQASTVVIYAHAQMSSGYIDCVGV